MPKKKVRLNTKNCSQRPHDEDSKTIENVERAVQEALGLTHRLRVNYTCYVKIEVKVPVKFGFITRDKFVGTDISVNLNNEIDPADIDRFLQQNPNSIDLENVQRLEWERVRTQFLDDIRRKKLSYEVNSVTALEDDEDANR